MFKSLAERLKSAQARFHKVAVGGCRPGIVCHVLTTYENLNRGISSSLNGIEEKMMRPISLAELEEGFIETCTGTLLSIENTVDSVYNELAYNEILLIAKCLAWHYIFPMFLMLQNSG